jgi:hypothetical protein
VTRVDVTVLGIPDCRGPAPGHARTHPQAGAVIFSAAQASQLGTDIFGPLLDS